MIKNISDEPINVVNIKEKCNVNLSYTNGYNVKETATLDYDCKAGKYEVNTTVNGYSQTFNPQLPTNSEGCSFQLPAGEVYSWSMVNYNFDLEGVEGKEECVATYVTDHGNIDIPITITF